VWNGQSGTFTASPSSTPRKNEFGGAGAELCHERAVGAMLRELVKIERAGRGIDRRESDEHERAATDRVDHELVGRARRARAAPELDDEKRGDKAQLPEHKPVEEIEREKHAERRALQQEKSALSIRGACFTRHEASSAAGVTRPVSSTSTRLRPSSPR